MTLFIAGCFAMIATLLIWIALILEEIRTELRKAL